MKTTMFILLLQMQYLTVTFSQSAIEPSSDRQLESIEDENALVRAGELWEELRSRPIDITHPSYGDLMRIPFISPLLAESIIQLTDTVTITAVEQILAAELMTEQLYQEIAPFITVRQKEIPGVSSFFLPAVIESRTRWKDRLTPTIGVRTGRFLGDRYTLYQKIRWENTRTAAAVVMKKDPGEPMRYGSLSGYVSLRSDHFMRELVAGMYTIGSGEGMVFGKNSTGSKGTDAVTHVQRRGKTISPVASTDELYPFRGAATHIRLFDVSITGMVSHKHLPATIDEDDRVSSIATTAVYRTENDLRRKDRLRETAAGAVIEVPVAAGHITGSLLNVRYDKNFTVSERNDGNGKELSAGGVSWRFPITPFLLFGEMATNDGKRISGNGGIRVDLHRSLRAIFHHRKIAQGFRSPYAGVFAEGSNLSEMEQGNYFGVEAEAGSTTFHLFADLFTIRPVNAFDAVGSDLLINGESTVAKGVSITTLFRQKKKNMSSTEREQQNLRLTIRVNVSAGWILRYRAETIVVDTAPQGTTEKGFLTSVDLAFRPHAGRNSVKTRFVLFDTPSYDSRLYFFESDVRGNFSNPPLYGKGFRWYCVAEWEPVENWRVSCKYSVTRKIFERQWGSGIDAIPGNEERQIAVQADFQF